MRKEDQGHGESNAKRNDPAHIDPTRLADAVDAILIALDEYKIDTRGGIIAPVDLLGLPNQPKVLCDYTRWEIEQAAAFMTRLGLLEPVKARKA
jgi:hypothetical protein